MTAFIIRTEMHTGTVCCDSKELPVSVIHGGHEPSFGRDRMVKIIDNYFDGQGIIGNVDSWTVQSLNNLADSVLDQASNRLQTK